MDLIWWFHHPVEPVDSVLIRLRAIPGGADDIIADMSDFLTDVLSGVISEELLYALHPDSPGFTPSFYNLESVLMGGKRSSGSESVKGIK
ncbi:MAG TPA: hypothetical protein VN372_07960 [Methanospirillum sp.]|nr:hypothetical protein [Methanospirillum sp.]